MSTTEKNWNKRIRMSKHCELLNEFGKFAISKLDLDWKTTGVREQTAEISREQLIHAGLVHQQQVTDNAKLVSKWRKWDSGTWSERVTLEYEY